jgi:hypothetical protein
MPWSNHSTYTKSKAAPDRRVREHTRNGKLGGARLIPVYHFMFRGGKRNGAMDAIRFHRERRSRVKLIGQHPFNQFPSLPAALRLGTQRRHLHAPFLPIEMKACHFLVRPLVAIGR